MVRIKSLSEVVLGAAYLFMGVGMFYKTIEFDSVMTKMSVAVIGIILTGGGIRKLYKNLLQKDES